MLTIKKRFDLFVDAADKDVIEDKLNEFHILMDHAEYFKGFETGVVRCNIRCSGSDTDIDRLIKYLRVEYKGMASITF